MATTMRLTAIGRPTNEEMEDGVRKAAGALIHDRMIGGDIAVQDIDGAAIKIALGLPNWVGVPVEIVHGVQMELTEKGYK